MCNVSYQKLERFQIFIVSDYDTLWTEWIIIVSVKKEAK